MRQVFRPLGIVLINIACMSAAASTLTLVVPNHMIVVPAAAGRQRAVLRTIWADERLLADVELDVYQLAGMRTTMEHYTELRRLASVPRWLDEITWRLERVDGGPPVIPAMPRVMRMNRRERGPNATSLRDRDATTPVTTLTARLDFGHLPVGDYRLTAAAAGLASSFPFSVRTGAEAEVRDDYLRDRAAKTQDYAEFRRIELERFDRDPARTDALLAIIDRSLAEGTSAEVTADFDRAIHAYEAKRPTLSLDALTKLDAFVRALQVARAALPEYFQHRREWWIGRDPYTSVYSIRSRDTNQVIRVLQAPGDHFDSERKSPRF